MSHSAYIDWIMYLVLWVSIGIVVFFIFTTVFAVLYHRMFYRRWYKPHFDVRYKPFCSVVVPCKGLPSGFEENIRSFFELAYERYTIVFTVESEQDPCVPVIRGAIAGKPNASLVIAGITKNCCQKNFNLIAAVDSDHAAEVFAFADSDISMQKNWLSELILPLSNKEFTVATGFRWLYSSRGSLGEVTHAYQNTVIFILFTVASFFKNIGLWGGSMAIRREDFETLEVRKVWSQSVVDDMSLSKLIERRGKKSIIVPACITPTSHALPSVGKSISWFHRQVMFLKAYQRSTWIIALCAVCLCLAVQVLLPVLCIVSLMTSSGISHELAKPVIIFFAGTMATTFFYPMINRYPMVMRFFLFQPISLFTVFLGVVRTLFAYTIDWSGFRYVFNRCGRVLSVQQCQKIEEIS